MKLDGRKTLLVCGIADAAIALYHVGFFFVIGPARGIFGGSAPHPGLPPMSLLVAAIFFLFAAYCFANAGVIRRLPALKLGLGIPAAIYTLYGAALLVQRTGAVMAPGAPDWTDLIVAGTIGIGALVLGIGHFIGLRAAGGAAVKINSGN